jgi:Spy/CpxP family protein refolding chaperone
VLLSTGLTRATAADKAEPAKAPIEASIDQKNMKPRMGGTLSEESRKMMQEAMAKLHDSNKATFDQIQSKRKELQDIMKAPAFDKAAYIAKKEEMQVLYHKMSKARTESLAEVLEKMKPEDRAKMGEGMRQGPRHMMKDGKGMGRGGGMMNLDRPMMDDPQPAEE